MVKIGMAQNIFGALRAPTFPPMQFSLITHPQKQQIHDCYIRACTCRYMYRVRCVQIPPEEAKGFKMPVMGASSGVATVGPGRACALPNIWCKPVQRCVEFRNATLRRAARGIYMLCTMSTACSRQLAQTVMMLMATGTTKRVRGPDEDLASVPGLPHERALIVRGRL